MVDLGTQMGGSRGYFPTTCWTLFQQIGKLTGTEKCEVLNLIIERYWKPVYCYIRAKGYRNEQSKDLVQEFFTSWLEKDIFGRADPKRGRFRAFLLSSLDNFLANELRNQHAKKRYPTKGIVSIDNLATAEDLAFEPVEHETPEIIFNRTWIAELLLRVLRHLEQVCQEKDQKVYYELFLHRVIKPTLEDSDPPPLEELAQKYGLTKKEASNRLITARRAYQRILREEICTYAWSEEDVASEIRDLFRFAAAK